MKQSSMKPLIESFIDFHLISGMVKLIMVVNSNYQRASYRHQDGRQLTLTPFYAIKEHLMKISDSIAIKLDPGSPGLRVVSVYQQFAFFLAS